MKCRIISTEADTKTSRYFERIGLPYKFVACECQQKEFEGVDTVFYKCAGVHGSNIARKNALLEDGCAVFDDDYTSLRYGGFASSDVPSVGWGNGKELNDFLDKLADIEKRYPKLILGGYSGGAIHGVGGRNSQNIMQVFFSGKINRFFREKSELYRLNDDVCACIMAKRRGYLTIGLWSLLRATQQPEGYDNTNNYDSRSYAKSFLPILYAPTAARIVWCKEKKLAKGKIRPGRFHHRIDWRKISPRVVEVE